MDLSQKEKMETTIKHFQSIPWTADLISNPIYRPTPTNSRTLKPPTNEDAFTAKTLATSDTIPYLLTLGLRDPAPFLTSPATGHPHNTTSTSDPFSFPPPRNAGQIWLLTISASGMSGEPSTLHGGAIATILDECLSSIVGVYVRAQNLVRRGPIYTANLSITYRRPVALPGTYAARAWIAATKRSKDGRTLVWIMGDIRDGEGNVYADGKGVWVEARGSKI